MASGSGKNQNYTETKEPVDFLSEESSNAAANAAAAAEPPPLAPQSEITEEEVHGPPEAGGRDRDRDREPSAATAAAAEQKGEETMSLFRRGSTKGVPSLPLHPRSVSATRCPRSASGKEVLASGMAMRTKWKWKNVFNELMLELQRSGETDQNAEPDGMPRQQNEQEVNSRALWPKAVKKQLWRKESKAATVTQPPPLVPQSEMIEEEVHGPPEAGGRGPFAATAAAAERKGEETMSLFRQGSASRKPPLPPRPPSVPRAKGPSSVGGKQNKQYHFPARRSVMIAMVLILFTLLLAAKSEAFQHFENLEDAAQRLSTLNNLGDLRMQLEEETFAPGAGFNFVLHSVFIGICTFLLMGLFSWFIDPKQ